MTSVSDEARVVALFCQILQEVKRQRRQSVSVTLACVKHCQSLRGFSDNQWHFHISKCILSGEKYCADLAEQDLEQKQRLSVAAGATAKRTRLLLRAAKCNICSIWRPRFISNMVQWFNPKMCDLQWKHKYKHKQSLIVFPSSWVSFRSC